jgi:thioesterase domain-containing protein
VTEPQNFIHELQHELHDTIPLVRALGLSVRRARSGLIEFGATLAPNINDKGCAFGGSLASLLTLACWSVLRVHTWQEQQVADIFVHTSRMNYIAPIWQDFTVHAQLDAAALAQFSATLAEKGKAAALIHAHVRVGDLVAVSMESRFVAKRAQAAATEPAATGAQ